MFRVSLGVDCGGQRSRERTATMSTKETKRQVSQTELVIKILNDNESAKDTIKPAVDTAKELQKLMLRMKGYAMSSDGAEVDYAKIKNSELFKEYRQMAAQLRDVNLDGLEEKERMALFINLYNALTIHGLAECDPLPESVLKVKQFWKTTAYYIGANVYTLDDIEHGILRGNRPHPASRKAPFAETDPRIKYSMKSLDPRIHFALVCGAKSCPAINVYTGENLETALNMATQNFCEQEIQTCDITREITASKIFQWYRLDFGKTDTDALRWTMPYLTEQKRLDLDGLLYVLESQGMVDIKYSEYNWGINGPVVKVKPLMPTPQPNDSLPS